MSEMPRYAAANKDAEIRALKQRIAELEKDAIPAGWKLVPVEPTTKMLRVLCASMGEDGELFAGKWALGSFREDYQMMLAAAPTPNDA